MGQLGNGWLVNTEEPYDVAGITDASDVAYGNKHGCAMHTNGSVSCWGDNQYSQVGLPANSPAFASTPVTLPNLTDVVDIDANGDVTCAVTGAGSVFCWGAVACVPYTGLDSCHGPHQVPDVNDAMMVSVGWNFACVLRASGAVACWGSQAEEGQLGDGTGLISATPVLAAGLPPAVAIESGRDHTCAVSSGGEVWCWGSNARGQLGDAYISEALTPNRIENLSGATGRPISGRHHVCVALDDHTVRCWGHNECGQLGDGTTNNSAEPVIVEGL